MMTKPKKKPLTKAPFYNPSSETIRFQIGSNPNTEPEEFVIEPGETLMGFPGYEKFYRRKGLRPGRGRDAEVVRKEALETAREANKLREQAEREKERAEAELAQARSLKADAELAKAEAQAEAARTDAKPEAKPEADAKSSKGKKGS